MRAGRFGPDQRINHLRRRPSLPYLSQGTFYVPGKTHARALRWRFQVARSHQRAQRSPYVCQVTSTCTLRYRSHLCIMAPDEAAAGNFAMQLWQARSAHLKSQAESRASSRSSSGVGGPGSGETHRHDRLAGSWSMVAR